jgi:UDP-glucose:tetrahydrobiopterin glucosyltransferase
VTGFVVPADDVDALVAAVGRVGAIDRQACRRRVDEHYSTEALAGRIEAWLHEVLAASATADCQVVRRPA